MKKWIFLFLALVMVVKLAVWQWDAAVKKRHEKPAAKEEAKPAEAPAPAAPAATPAPAAPRSPQEVIRWTSDHCRTGQQHLFLS